MDAFDVFDDDANDAEKSVVLMDTFFAVRLVLALLAPVAVVSTSKVVVLTDDTFEGFANDNSAFLVMFYAPWCGHSRALAPEYEQVASELAVNLPVAKVDGTEAEDIATQHDIKGYPTILFVRDGAADEYDGARTRSDIMKWARGKISPALKRLHSVSAIEDWKRGARITALLLLAAPFKQADEQLPHYRAMLGLAGATAVPCGVSEVPPLELALPDLSLPALVVFQKFDDGHRVLSGAAFGKGHKQMLRFVKQESLPYVSQYSSATEDALFSAEVDLHVLHFHSEPVALPAPLEAVARKLRGEVSVATIDVSKDAFHEVAEYFDVAPRGQLQTPVTLVFHVNNGTKYVHRGPHEGPALIDFVRSLQRGAQAAHARSQPVPAASDGSLVTELVGSNFLSTSQDEEHDVLVMLYSPDCGHCRKLMPVYAKVAAELAKESDVIVAQMNADANDAVGLDPEGFPTILFYPKINKKGVEYDGSRDVHDLVQFVLEVREGRGHIGGLSSSDLDDASAAAKLEL